ncbi:MAG: hypothetical protein ACPGPS_19085, partial [Rubripirellula sp.]
QAVLYLIGSNQIPSGRERMAVLSQVKLEEKWKNQCNEIKSKILNQQATGCSDTQRHKTHLHRHAMEPSARNWFDQQTAQTESLQAMTLWTFD